MFESFTVKNVDPNFEFRRNVFPTRTEQKINVELFRTVAPRRKIDFLRRFESIRFDIEQTRNDAERTFPIG